MQFFKKTCVLTFNGLFGACVASLWMAQKCSWTELYGLMPTHMTEARPQDAA
jgi:hypothetical protein